MPFRLPALITNKQQRLKRDVKNIPYRNPCYSCAYAACSLGETTRLLGQIPAAVTPLLLLAVGPQRRSTAGPCTTPLAIQAWDVILLVQLCLASLFLT